MGLIEQGLMLAALLLALASPGPLHAHKGPHARAQLGSGVAFAADGSLPRARCSSAIPSR